MLLLLTLEYEAFEYRTGRCLVWRIVPWYGFYFILARVPNHHTKVVMAVDCLLKAETR